MGKSTKATIFRGTSALCYFLASVIMLAYKQKVQAGTVAFTAKYSDWNGLPFVAVVSLSLCIYNCGVLCIRSGSKFWRLVILVDLVLCTFSCATLGAGWQTYSLFIEGNIYSIYANWSPICGVVPNFCRITLVSLVFSTIGFVFIFLLNVICVCVSVDALLENS